MRQKRLMLLGGTRFLIPVIRKAHELGIYVITADYLPDNLAHPYADEYVNVSVIDREAVLEAARRLKVDGILSYACDPGALAAAYASEKLGLRFPCSYEAARILQDKGRFRRFLRDNGFNCPRARRYESEEEALREIADAGPRNPCVPEFPVFVKPVDSAGSKGCSRADSVEELKLSIAKAMANSFCGAIVVEDYLVIEGRHAGIEAFVADGQLKSAVFFDNVFDPRMANAAVPVFGVYPSAMPANHQRQLTEDIGRLMKLLPARAGLFDIEVCVANGGVPYIMEVSPRAGGDRVAELIEFATGARLVENDIRASVGMPLTEFGGDEDCGCWLVSTLHAPAGCKGTFSRLEFAPGFSSAHVKVVDLNVQEGDPVLTLTGTNRSLGNVFLQFDSREEMSGFVADEYSRMRVVLK